MRTVAAIAAALALAGCAAPTAPGPIFAPVIAGRAAGPPPLAGPALAAPGPLRPPPGPRIDNAALGRDLMEIAFTLESGRRLPVLTRFEAPVRVRLLAPGRGGDVPALRRDMAELIARLRREAGIDIAAAPAGGPAEITVEVVPARALRGAVPGAACFVAPGVAGWADYLRGGRGPGVDWTRLAVRTRAAVFIPADSPPQEMRDCLHEEIAQALGPVGDLHRMTDSVFNDDNFHGVLTRRDMLMLRAVYDPALRSGMGPDAVAAALPGVLARLNPGGGRGVPLPPEPPPPAEWRRAIVAATGASRSRPVRRRAAEEALRLAPADGALAAFSHYVIGRVAMPEDPARAEAALARAQAIYGAMPEAAVPAAHVALPRAILALENGRAQEALLIASRAAPVAEAARDAALLAGLLSVRAEALVALGRPAEAARARLDSLPLARYGFGPA